MEGLDQVNERMCIQATKLVSSKLRPQVVGPDLTLRWSLLVDKDEHHCRLHTPLHGRKVTAETLGTKSVYGSKRVDMKGREAIWYNGMIGILLVVQESPEFMRMITGV
jgi:hypothetical protein